MLVVKNPQNWTPRDANEFFRKNGSIWIDLNEGKEIEIADEMYPYIQKFVTICPSKGIKFKKKNEITAQSFEQTNIKE